MKKHNKRREELVIKRSISGRLFLDTEDGELEVSYILEPIDFYLKKKETTFTPSYAIFSFDYGPRYWNYRDDSDLTRAFAVRSRSDG